MSVIHAFICSESNLVFKSKLAIHHQYINNIEEDRIPTSKKSLNQRAMDEPRLSTPIHIHKHIVKPLLNSN